MRYPIIEFPAAPSPFSTYRTETQLNWYLARFMGPDRGSELIDADGRLYRVERVEVLRPKSALLCAIKRHIGGRVHAEMRLSGGETKVALGDLKRRVVDALNQHEEFYASGGPVDVQKRVVDRCVTHEEVIAMS